MKIDNTPVEKLATEIPGFDLIAGGGLPKGRSTLMAGTAGSAKTVFAAQFLAEGIIKRNEPGVFVTFEEPVHDIRQNMLGFGWTIESWERAGKWTFVDASLQPDEEFVVAGGYDLGGLLARIELAVKKVGAKRVSIDSLGAIFFRFSKHTTIRVELLRIATALKQMKVTTVMTVERTAEYGAIARHGVEEFVADNVIILRNVLEAEKRRRTVEILKFRGAHHHKGEYPFTIIPDQGIDIIPLSALELTQKSSDLRVTSGNHVLDEMCGGGFFRGSVILVSGATGTGKTLTVTNFITGGVAQKEKCLLFAFEESRQQLSRNAQNWGVDFEQLEARGRLKLVCNYPEVADLEDHLCRMKAVMEEFQPDRVAVDSLSALERISTKKGFREFILSLTSYVKQMEISTLFTNTTPTLVGGTSASEANISTITDAIILLRYVEVYGEMRRGITVLKMRGSMHDKDIREFMIDHQGMHIGKPFRNVTGILAGMPTHTTAEIDRLGGLFRDDIEP
jgi:circadian clock protein KaiC